MGENSVAIYFTELGRNYLALTSPSTTQHNPYIFITKKRDLDTIVGNNVVCHESSSAIFTYNGEKITAGDNFQWALVSTDGNTTYDTHSGTALSDGDVTSTQYSIIPSTLTAGNYYVKLVIKNVCCGLSIPIWKEITVSQLEATIEFGD